MVSYSAVHRRLVVERGRADSHDCASAVVGLRPCGRLAAEWAYTGPREASERWPYSEDLTLYVPLCRQHHKAYDRASVRASERHPADALLF